MSKQLLFDHHAFSAMTAINTLHDAEIVGFDVSNGDDLILTLELHEFAEERKRNSALVQVRFLGFKSDDLSDREDLIGYGIYELRVDPNGKSVYLSSSVTGFDGKFERLAFSRVEQSEFRTSSAS